MHSPPPQPKRKTKKSRGEGASGGRLPGPLDPFRDLETFGQVIDALGDGDRSDAACRARAAAKIGCDRATLGRLLRSKQAPTRATVRKLIQAAQAHSPDLGEKALLAIRSPEAGRLMDRYFEWLESSLKRYRSRPGVLGRWAIPMSYDNPGGILYEFRAWMAQKDVQAEDQELAIWHIVEPFLDAAESGFVEVGASDFLCQDWTKGQKKDERLLKFLAHRIESEKLRLVVRGSVQHRIQKLAAAAAADTALAATVAPSKAEQTERDHVYWKHRIPASYSLGIPPPSGS
jgi:hypothetical protein